MIDKPEGWNEPDTEWSTPGLFYAGYPKGVELIFEGRKPIYIDAETARRLAARIVRDFGETQTGFVPFKDRGPISPLQKN